MFEFQALRAYRDKIFVIIIPVIQHCDFLEYHEPRSLGIKQAAVEPQCGYPKIWWQKCQKFSIYNHKTFNDVRSNPSSEEEILRELMVVCATVFFFFSVLTADKTLTHVTLNFIRMYMYIHSCLLYLKSHLLCEPATYDLEPQIPRCRKTLNRIFFVVCSISNSTEILWLVLYLIKFIDICIFLIKFWCQEQQQTDIVSWLGMKGTPVIHKQGWGEVHHSRILLHRLGITLCNYGSDGISV